MHHFIVSHTTPLTLRLRRASRHANASTSITGTVRRLLNRNIFPSSRRRVPYPKLSGNSVSADLPSPFYLSIYLLSPPTISTIPPSFPPSLCTISTIPPFLSHILQLYPSCHRRLNRNQKRRRCCFYFCLYYYLLVLHQAIFLRNFFYSSVFLSFFSFHVRVILWELIKFVYSCTLTGQSSRKFLRLSRVIRNLRVCLTDF